MENDVIDVFCWRCNEFVRAKVRVSLGCAYILPTHIAGVSITVIVTCTRCGFAVAMFSGEIESDKPLWLTEDEKSEVE